ncbi:MAG TPA: hypothetical protein V6C81_28155 [Planktothrix sp.]|jgi:hypothetical protein
MSLLLAAVIVSCVTAGCGPPPVDANLTKNVYLELVDWHVAGLWVINSPVAWIRVANYNQVAVKDITFQYNTYDEDNTPLDEGTFTIIDTEGKSAVLRGGQMHNYIEQYLGVVNLRSQKLRVKLLGVNAA